MLFLSKTFPSLPGIGLRLDGIGKDYFWGFSDSTDRDRGHFGVSQRSGSEVVCVTNLPLISWRSAILLFCFSPPL